MVDYIVSYIQGGDFKSIRKFIDSLSSINDYIYEDDENCFNLLHLAAGIDCEYKEEIIELLLLLRADVNYKAKIDDVEDVRALHIAAMWGYDLTVKLLLYHGADASLRDSEGFSPVDHANNSQEYLCISLLLRYGSLNSTAAAWSAIIESNSGGNLTDSLKTDDDSTDSTVPNFESDTTASNQSSCSSEGKKHLANKYFYQFRNNQS